MKKIIITLILSIPILGNAQNITDWQVGFNVNPFMFTKINSEFNYQKDKQDIPNGFGFGLTIEKNWNEHWGIKTGFESTKQNEKYFFDVVGDNTKINSSFKYYKVPITIQYFYPLSEKLYLIFNQGIQFSFLKYYKTTFKDDYQIRTLTSDYEEYISYQYPNTNYITYGKYNGIIHEKNIYGIIGSIGLKGFLSDKISYSTNIRYEYDLNSADNLPYYSSTPGNTKREGITHNLRIGLELGFQYHFSIGDRFDKRPHKL